MSDSIIASNSFRSTHEGKGCYLSESDARGNIADSDFCGTLADVRRVSRGSVVRLAGSTINRQNPQ